MTSGALIQPMIRTVPPQVRQVSIWIPRLVPNVRCTANSSPSSAAADCPLWVQAVSKPKGFASLRDSAAPRPAERPLSQDLHTTSARFTRKRRFGRSTVLGQGGFSHTLGRQETAIGRARPGVVSQALGASG
jgi:hypothetical protein